MRSIEETKQFLNEINDFQSVEIQNLFFDISKLLQGVSTPKVLELESQIKANIEAYFGNELEKEVKRLESHLYSHNLEIKDSVSGFFELIHDDYYDEAYIPISDLIIEEFQVLNAEDTPFYDALDSCLIDKYKYDSLTDYEEHVYFAILALSYFNEAIDEMHSDYVYDLWIDMNRILDIEELRLILKISSFKTMFKAFSTMQYAYERKNNKSLLEKLDQLKNEIIINEQSKEKIENDLKKQHAIKAANKKHEGNRQKKHACINEWHIHEKEQLAKGKIPSKNAFSAMVMKKYNMAYTTIRDNWLKGI